MEEAVFYVFCKSLICSGSNKPPGLSSKGPTKQKGDKKKYKKKSEHYLSLFVNCVYLWYFNASPQEGQGSNKPPGM